MKSTKANISGKYKAKSLKTALEAKVKCTRERLCGKRMYCPCTSLHRFISEKTWHSDVLCVHECKNLFDKFCVSCNRKWYFSSQICVYMSIFERNLLFSYSSFYKMFSILMFSIQKLIYLFAKYTTIVFSMSYNCIASIQYYISR